MMEMEKEMMEIMEREMKWKVSEMKEEEKTKCMLYLLYRRVYGSVKEEKVVFKRVEVEEEKVNKKRMKRIPMPYTGKKEESCECVRENYGLYTQCENEKEKSSKYCKECEKEKAYEKYGNMERRISMEKGKYVDMRGKKETNYKKVLEKMGISKEEAMEEGKKRGINIEEYYIDVEVKRGRPKKEDKMEVVVVEKKEEVVEVVEKREKVEVEVKRKKGRPRKAEKVLQSNEEEDDMFMEIVKKMENVELEDKKEEKVDRKEEKVEEEKVEKEVEEEVIEEVIEDRVKKIKYEGIEYLKSKLTNIVYNMEEEIVGRWDEKERKIVFNESEEEYESEEEEEEYV